MANPSDVEIELQQRIENTEATKWKISAPSELSLESEDRKNVNSPLNQHLEYIPQKGVDTLRRLVPATWNEVLTFYRCYLSATTKSPLVCLQFIKLNRFLWNHIFTVVFKSLPQTYVYMFLASYAPDEHFFLSKMVPITYGFTFLYIVAGFIDCMYYTETTMRLLDTGLMAIIFKNPWNRCNANKSVYSRIYNETIKCNTMAEVKEKIRTNRTYFTGFGYQFKDGEYFNIAHVIYYFNRATQLVKPIVKHTNISLFFIYSAFIWIIITMLGHNQLYKRNIWKILYVSQWVVNFIYIVVFCHVTIDYFWYHFGESINSTYNINITEFQRSLEIIDIDILSETMTAPPSMHILSSRVDREIKASRDSTIIIILNTVYYLFKSMLLNAIKNYCESLIEMHITILYFSSTSFLYIWQMYFSTMFMGELFTIIFFFLHFVMELTCAIITFQCLLEAVVCEWKWAKRTLVTIIFTLVGLTFRYFLKPNYLQFWYISTRCMATFLEVLGIYCLYPIGRLIEDITFFSGVKPTKLRVINLKLVPIYYGIKLYMMIVEIKNIHLDGFLELDAINIFLMSLVALGTLYICCLICIHKKKLSALFKPDSSFGPEFQVRQIRKKYDSRKFIGCQSPRILSRYMLYKAEAKVYKLDIRYDKTSRKSTAPDVEVMVENEQKKDI